MDYETYINSAEWKAKANQARAAQKSCNVCRTRKHLCVHHRTYANFGDEKPEDLLVLCRKCHEELHAWLDKKYPLLGTGRQVLHTGLAVRALQQRLESGKKPKKQRKGKKGKKKKPEKQSCHQNNREKKSFAPMSDKELSEAVGRMFGGRSKLPDRILKKLKDLPPPTKSKIPPIGPTPPFIGQSLARKKGG